MKSHKRVRRPIPKLAKTSDLVLELMAADVPIVEIARAMGVNLFHKGEVDRFLALVFRNRVSDKVGLVGLRERLMLRR